MNQEQDNGFSILETVKLQLQHIIQIPEIIINAVSPTLTTRGAGGNKSSATMETFNLAL